MPAIICIIPVRMGSSRFPGKPLAPILGIPMVEHVYRRAEMCAFLDGVYIATCDHRIREDAEAFGAKVIMTSERHERASDRVAEAAETLPADIVVMLQGDEPMTTPEMIEAAVRPMQQDEDIRCVNLVKRIVDEEEYRDPNTIKTVMDLNHNALYFSREPIPTATVKGFQSVCVYKQVCVIPFRKDFLLDYSMLDSTPLEQAESVDMMRVLEHGFSVRLVEVQTNTHAVDTPEDLIFVESMMRDDPLVRHYRNRTNSQE